MKSQLLKKLEKLGNAFDKLFNHDKRAEIFNTTTILSRILYYADDKTKLAIRRLNKKSRGSVKTFQHGYYQTKAEFMMAATGTFFKKSYFNNAWDVYYSSFISGSQKSIILYKLSERQFLNASGELEKLADHEDMLATGRMYAPISKHAWDVNKMWVKAQIELGREAKIYSNFSYKNIYRTNHPSMYSAFMKEIALLIKAGYNVSHIEPIVINSKTVNTITLSPPNPKKILTMDDLDPTTQDIEEKAIPILVNALLAYKKITQAVKTLKNLFNEINNAGYQHDEEALREKISKALMDPFLNCKNKALTLKMFIEGFNRNRPQHAPMLSMNQLSLLSIEQTLEDLKHGMLSSLLQHVTATPRLSL